MNSDGRARHRAAINAALSDSPERGVAMVMVIGLMVVTGVVAATLTSVAVFNTGVTAGTRTQVQVQAAADAGVDLMLSKLDGIKYNKLHNLCTDSATVDGIPVDISIAYTLSDGRTVGCPQSATEGATTVKLAITSSAEATNPVGGADVTRSVVAELAMVAAGGPGPTMDKALFGESSFELTNDTQLSESAPGLADAHVYSNGGVECKTQLAVEGSIHAAGGRLKLENNCKVKGSAWASGPVEMSSNASVAGDLYSASDVTGSGHWAVSLKNYGQVSGNLLTNGNVLIEEKHNGEANNVGGFVFTNDGLVQMTQNGPRVGGSVYAGSSITLGNGGRIGKDAVSRTGSIGVENSNNWIGGKARAKGSIASSNLTVVGGTATGGDQNFPSTPDPAAVLPASISFPGPVPAPPREQFPAVLASASEYESWEAAGWQVKTLNNVCTSDQVKNAIPAEQSGVKTMLVFTGCSGGIEVDNGSFTLKNDLAIISERGMSFKNDLTFVGQGGASHHLYLMVPAGAPNVQWKSVSGGQTTPECSTDQKISINKLKPNGTKVLIYTPCTVEWQNGTDGQTFPGQIYAGTIDLPNQIKMKMISMPVPSLGSGGSSGASPSAPVETTMTSRYDVTGG